MGIRVLFSCTNGNALIGTPEITCLPSGNWSAPLPVCESVECGEVPIQANNNGSAPRVAILSREVGGRSAFSCPPGYGLRGPSEAICLPSGEWGGPFPTCVGRLPGALCGGIACFTLTKLRPFIQRFSVSIRELHRTDTHRERPLTGLEMLCSLIATRST